MKEEILSDMIETVQAVLGSGFTVQYKEVPKNNGLLWKACLIRAGEETVAPAIYIDRILQEIEEGKLSVNGAAMEIVRVYNEDENKRESVKCNTLQSKEGILGNVVYSLVNREKNAEYLLGAPFQKFLDLAVTYRVIMYQQENEAGTVALTNELCEGYGIHEDELEYAARKNTEAREFCIWSLEEVLAKLADLPVEPVNTPWIWVCTNKEKVHGASIMLYGRYFYDLANKAEDDLIILPSSIHEVIALPAGIASGRPIQDMRDMVREINTSNVPANEVLSDNVYLYSRETGEITIMQEER